MDLEVAAISLSIISILLTLYLTVCYPKHKKCSAKLVWDEIKCTFDLVIWNTGPASILIDSVELYYMNGLERVSLGKRNNFFNNVLGANVLKKGLAISYEPIYGSLYDVFGYKGHAFDVDEKNEDKKVYIELVDIVGDSFTSDSSLKLGEIDKYIDSHNSLEMN